MPRPGLAYLGVPLLFCTKGSERKGEGLLMTSIRDCSCRHEYQDSVYGVGKRVHNLGGAGKGMAKWVCTVCGKAKGVSEKRSTSLLEGKKGDKRWDRI